MISMPLLGEISPKVRMTALPPKPRRSLACSGATKAQSGIPCGMIWIFAAGTSYSERSNCRPFSAMTITLVETSTISRNTRRCTGLGVARTVCSVVTIGMSTPANKVMT